MNENELIGIFEEHSEVFSQSSVIVDAFSTIGWIIVKAMRIILNGFDSIITEIYTLFGLTTSEEVTGFMDMAFPLFMCLIGIGIVYLGYSLMTGKINNRSAILRNFLVMLLVITCMPVFAAQMSELTLGGINAVRSTYTQTGAIADDIIINSVTDLKYLDRNGFDFGQGKNHLSSDSLSSIKITEKMDPEDASLKNPEVFGSAVVVDSSGKKSIEKIDYGGWLDLFPEFYYRFNVDWLSLIIVLITMTAVLAFSCYKVARIIIEITIHEFLACLLAVTDLTTGQRTKEALKSMLSLFTVVFLTTVILKFYFIAETYFNRLKTDGQIGTITYIICMAAAAVVVIDGPNVIERIFGVDAGIKSGYHTLIGGIALGRSAIGAGKAVRNTAIGDPGKNTRYDKDGNRKRELGGLFGGVKKAGEKAANAAAGAAGFAVGIDGKPDSEGKSSDGRNEDGMRGGRMNDSEEKRKKNEGGEDRTGFSNTNAENNLKDNRDKNDSNGISGDKEKANEKNRENSHENGNSIIMPGISINNGLNSTDSGEDDFLRRSINAQPTGITGSAAKTDLMTKKEESDNAETEAKESRDSLTGNEKSEEGISATSAGEIGATGYDESAGASESNGIVEDAWNNDSMTKKEESDKAETEAQESRDCLTGNEKSEEGISVIQAGEIGATGYDESAGAYESNGIIEDAGNNDERSTVTDSDGMKDETSENNLNGSIEMSENLPESIIEGKNSSNEQENLSEEDTGSNVMNGISKVGAVPENSGRIPLGESVNAESGRISQGIESETPAGVKTGIPVKEGNPAKAEGYQMESGSIGVPGEKSASVIEKKPELAKPVSDMRNSKGGFDSDEVNVKITSGFGINHEKEGLNSAPEYERRSEKSDDGYKIIDENSGRIPLGESVNAESGRISQGIESETPAGVKTGISVKERNPAKAEGYQMESGSIGVPGEKSASVIEKKPELAKHVSDMRNSKGGFDSDAVNGKITSGFGINHEKEGLNSAPVYEHRSEGIDGSNKLSEMNVKNNKGMRFDEEKDTALHYEKAVSGNDSLRKDETREGLSSGRRTHTIYDSLYNSAKKEIKAKSENSQLIRNYERGKRKGEEMHERINSGMNSHKMKSDIKESEKNYGKKRGSKK